MSVKLKILQPSTRRLWVNLLFCNNHSISLKSKKPIHLKSAYVCAQAPSFFMPSPATSKSPNNLLVWAAWPISEYNPNWKHTHIWLADFLPNSILINSKSNVKQISPGNPYLIKIHSKNPSNQNWPSLKSLKP